MKFVKRGFFPGWCDPDFRAETFGSLELTIGVFGEVFPSPKKAIKKGTELVPSMAPDHLVVHS